MAGTFPAVLITGARQTGKTSLLRREFADAAYISLDLPANAEAAETAPEHLLGDYPGPIIVDEIQYAPSLLRYIKHRMNEDRTPGQYLLTGSQIFPLMEGVSESLAGRCGILNLQTFSFSEVGGPEGKHSVKSYIFKGGYPELYLGAERDLWYPSYIATYLERDVRNVLNVTNLKDFNRFLRACALRTSQILNYTDLARDTGVAPNTARKWLTLLQASSIVTLVEPYFGNRTKRLTKAPKMCFLDTGLAAFLNGFSTEEHLFSSTMAGAFWETFVIGQLWRHMAFRGLDPTIHFWRTAGGNEVDIIIEQADGKIIAAECKLKEYADLSDARGLQTIAEVEGERISDRFIVCRTPNSYRLSDGTWVVSIEGFLRKIG